MPKDWKKSIVIAWTDGKHFFPKPSCDTADKNHLRAWKRVFHLFVSLFEEMMTHLILSRSVTCQPPHALSLWQLTAREAKDHGCCVRHSGEVGGRQAKCTMCVYARAYVPAHECTCECVCVCVCQSEGMDACHRREQHHVRVLADDAHFRYTNSNSQLSHETISSHDSPHSLPLCCMCVSRLLQGVARASPWSTVQIISRSPACRDGWCWASGFSPTLFMSEGEQSRAKCTWL